VRARNQKLARWFTLVAALALLNYVSRFTSGKPPPDTLYRYDTAITGTIFYGLTLLIVLWIARGLSNGELGLRRPQSWPRALGLALAVLFALLVVEVALEAILHGTREQGLQPNRWDSAKAVPFVLNAIVIAVFAPIVEELTYRGVGFALLLRFGAFMAVGGTAVAFAADHGLVEGFLALFVFGLAVAFLRLRTDSIYPGMLLHATFNALALAEALIR
jgi:CAAX protease family protein